ncbi:MAG TPA: IS200/IS605 family transposase [Lacipirellulaceae bacterium]|nr:IS200/IS605 family transposase [Lacipirellulaceae bacterium]
MAQSLSNVILHLVFSTKNRKPWIDVEIETELFKYLAGVCREIKCPSHKIGGTDDHIHIACTLARTMAISTLLEEVKTSSSKWIKAKGDEYHDFAWQNGYGAFSIGQSQLPDLKNYIANQREHHRRVSFQDEYRQILAKYEVEYDERYVWD